MIPQTGGLLRQDFSFIQLPSKTFKLDRENGCIVGMADGLEAVRQAVYLILNTEHCQWLIHSWGYGAELQSLVGKPPDFCVAEIERRVREALLQDDRIRSVENFTFEVSKKTIAAQFTVVSIFGEVPVGAEVTV